jgi:two-component system phosphate regulon sensor histidine kinase PhoR
VTVFDASERRRYERELLQARGDAETRAAAAGALMHVAEAVVLVDADGVVRVANPAAEQLFGVAGLVGSRLADAAPGWNAVASRIPVAAEPSWVVVPLAIADATRWVAAAAEPEAGGAVYTLRDVTDERRLADMRDEIVATVSHELRTPLAGVLGAAKTLTSREDSLTEETRRALIGMIGEQSARLARIVEEILLTQGLDAGGVELERRTFDVGELVERVVAAAPADGRRIRVDTAQGALAEGDPDRFEQVVLNLLDNAVKYSPPETEIRIAVERERGSVRLTVADNGPGIPPADRERIFDKFVRLDPAHAGGVGGTGLGLSIARELVRRMGGRVGVLDSERGATFCVDLPAAV